MPINDTYILAVSLAQELGTTLTSYLLSIPVWSLTESCGGRGSHKHPPPHLCLCCLHSLPLEAEVSFLVWPAISPPSAYTSPTWLPPRPHLPLMPFACSPSCTFSLLLSFCPNSMASSRAGGNLPSLWSLHLRTNKLHIFRWLQFSL